MKTLFSWFNDRTGFGAWCGRLADSPVPGGACWCKVLPCTILFIFCVQAITGFFLWAYYSPSAQTAWESVYYLQYHVVGGWLLAGDPSLRGPRAAGGAYPLHRAKHSDPRVPPSPRTGLLGHRGAGALSRWRPF